MYPGLMMNNIDQIKESVDIVDVIGRVVDLNRRNKEYVGLCPFHKERTPSFTVVPDQQFFYCFGCQAGGDVFEFVKLYESVTFSEALEFLSRQAGIHIDKDQEESEEYQLLKLNKLVMDYYAQQTEIVRAFLDSRKLPGDLQEIFHIGYVPQGGSDLLQKTGKLSMLKKIGVIKDDGRTERFRGRILFPIIHHRYPLGFGGRLVKGYGPKYLNSPESSIYHKSELLFGLQQSKQAARRKEQVIIAEGYTDVLAFHAAGFSHAMATCGTAFTDDQARLLLRLVDAVYFAYDGDRAGAKALYRSVKTALKYGLVPYVIAMNAGEDPASVYEERGRSGLQLLVENAPVYAEYYDRLTQNRPVEKRLKFVREMQEVLQSIRDRAVRDVLSRQFEDVFSVDVVDKKWRESKAKPVKRTLDNLALGYLMRLDTSHFFSHFSAEDFLEREEIFRYILSRDEDERVQYSDIISQFPNDKRYISEAITRTGSQSDAVARKTAMRLQARVFRRDMARLSEEIDSTADEQSADQLQVEWESIRQKLHFIEQLTPEPPW